MDEFALYIIENYPHLVRKFRRHKTEKEDWIRMMLEDIFDINLKEIEDGAIKNCLIIIKDWFKTYVEDWICWLGLQKTWLLN